jgi:hypothetical protein
VFQILPYSDRSLQHVVAYPEDRLCGTFAAADAIARRKVW